MEEWKYSSTIHNIVIRWGMEGSGQLHAPDALTPGKEPQIRIGYEV
jgi:hypothetical protein